MEVVDSGNITLMTIDLDGDGIPETEWTLYALAP